jgi:hypothetical protein
MIIIPHIQQSVKDCIKYNIYHQYKASDGEVSCKLGNNFIFKSKADEQKYALKESINKLINIRIIQYMYTLDKNNVYIIIN